jgi:hypothetical protein
VADTGLEEAVSPSRIICVKNAFLKTNAKRLALCA